MKKLFFLIFILCSVLIYCQASTEIYCDTAAEILDKVDYNMTPDKVIYQGEMIINKKDKVYKKNMNIRAIGAEKAFIEFTSPPRDKGTRYLRNDENLWMYFPKANRTIKISGHMLRQNMMGSDISYEDQTDRNKLSELYDATILSKTDEMYTLELVAKEGVDTSYHRRVIDIDKATYTLKNSSMYAKSGKLLKILTVEEIQKIGDRYYITNFKMEDKIRLDSYTRLILKNIQINSDIPENVFTLKNLERR